MSQTARPRSRTAVGTRSGLSALLGDLNFPLTTRSEDHSNNRNNKDNSNNNENRAVNSRTTLNPSDVGINNNIAANGGGTASEPKSGGGSEKTTPRKSEDNGKGKRQLQPHSTPELMFSLRASSHLVQHGQKQQEDETAAADEAEPHLHQNQKRTTSRRRGLTVSGSYSTTVASASSTLLSQQQQPRNGAPTCSSSASSSSSTSATLPLAVSRRFSSHVAASAANASLSSSANPQSSKRPRTSAITTATATATSTSSTPTPTLNIPSRGLASASAASATASTIILDSTPGLILYASRPMTRGEDATIPSYYKAPVVERLIQNVKSLSCAGTQTEFVPLTTTGQRHSEGGWPASIEALMQSNESSLEEESGKYLKRVLREDKYAVQLESCVKKLMTGMRCNAAVEIYSMAFSDYYDEVQRRQEEQMAENCSGPANGSGSGGGRGRQFSNNNINGPRSQSQQQEQSGDHQQKQRSGGIIGSSPITTTTTRDPLQEAQLRIIESPISVPKYLSLVTSSQYDTPQPFNDCLLTSMAWCPGASQIAALAFEPSQNIYSSFLQQVGEKFYIPLALIIDVDAAKRELRSHDVGSGAGAGSSNNIMDLGAETGSTGPSGGTHLRSPTSPSLPFGATSSSNSRKGQVSAAAASTSTTITTITTGAAATATGRASSRTSKSHTVLCAPVESGAITTISFGLKNGNTYVLAGTATGGVLMWDFRDRAVSGLLRVKEEQKKELAAAQGGTRATRCGGGKSNKGASVSAAAAAGLSPSQSSSFDYTTNANFNTSAQGGGGGRSTGVGGTFPGISSHLTSTASLHQRKLQQQQLSSVFTSPSAPSIGLGDAAAATATTTTGRSQIQRLHLQQQLQQQQQWQEQQQRLQRQQQQQQSERALAVLDQISDSWIAPCGAALPPRVSSHRTAVVTVRAIPGRAPYEEFISVGIDGALLQWDSRYVNSGPLANFPFSMVMPQLQNHFVSAFGIEDDGDEGDEFSQMFRLPAAPRSATTRKKSTTSTVGPEDDVAASSHRARQTSVHRAKLGVSDEGEGAEEGNVDKGDGNDDDDDDHDDEEFEGKIKKVMKRDATMRFERGRRHSASQQPAAHQPGDFPLSIPIVDVLVTSEQRRQHVELVVDGGGTSGSLRNSTRPNAAPLQEDSQLVQQQQVQQQQQGQNEKRRMSITSHHEPVLFLDGYEEEFDDDEEEEEDEEEEVFDEDDLLHQYFAADLISVEKEVFPACVEFEPNIGGATRVVVADSEGSVRVVSRLQNVQPIQSAMSPQLPPRQQQHQLGTNQFLQGSTSMMTAMGSMDASMSLHGGRPASTILFGVTNAQQVSSFIVLPSAVQAEQQRFVTNPDELTLSSPNQLQPQQQQQLLRSPTSNLNPGNSTTPPLRHLSPTPSAIQLAAAQKHQRALQQQQQQVGSIELTSTIESVHYGSLRGVVRSPHVPKFSVAFSSVDPTSGFCLLAEEARVLLRVGFGGVNSFNRIATLQQQQQRHHDHQEAHHGDVATAPCLFPRGNRALSGSGGRNRSVSPAGGPGSRHNSKKKSNNNNSSSNNNFTQQDGSDDFFGHRRHHDHHQHHFHDMSTSIGITALAWHPVHSSLLIGGTSNGDLMGWDLCRSFTEPVWTTKLFPKNARIDHIDVHSQGEVAFVSGSLEVVGSVHSHQMQQPAVTAFGTSSLKSMVFHQNIMQQQGAANGANFNNTSGLLLPQYHLDHQGNPSALRSGSKYGSGSLMTMMMNSSMLNLDLHRNYSNNNNNNSNNLGTLAENQLMNASVVASGNVFDNNNNSNIALTSPGNPAFAPHHHHHHHNHHHHHHQVATIRKGLLAMVRFPSLEEMIARSLSSNSSTATTNQANSNNLLAASPQVASRRRADLQAERAVLAHVLDHNLHVAKTKMQQDNVVRAAKAERERRKNEQRQFAEEKKSSCLVGASNNDKNKKLTSFVLDASALDDHHETIKNSRKKISGGRVGDGDDDGDDDNNFNSNDEGEDASNTIIVANSNIARMGSQTADVVRDSADLADTYLKMIEGDDVDEGEVVVRDGAHEEKETDEDDDD